ncbi:hypothetical protein X733_25030 [Mesorhizobium sp. L2C067A000]|nr:hypothetical protein X733_25030 [Mesorhizobium sp. L2C067A000]
MNVGVDGDPLSKAQRNFKSFLGLSGAGLEVGFHVYGVAHQLPDIGVI